MVSSAEDREWGIPGLRVPPRFYDPYLSDSRGYRYRAFLGLGRCYLYMTSWSESKKYIARFCGSREITSRLFRKSKRQTNKRLRLQTEDTINGIVTKTLLLTLLYD